VIVGVNKYTVPEERPIDILKIDHSVESHQVERVRKIKRTRDAGAVREHLGRVHAACRNGANLMPVLIDAVKEHCTLGEISDIYRDVFGVYRDPAWL
jgi:methylmalonyl-CoA mutase, N-terminal domain